MESSLAEAIGRASAAGQWGTVEALARELGARREARAASNVVAFKPRAKGRDRL